MHPRDRFLKVLGVLVLLVLSCASSSAAVSEADFNRAKAMHELKCAKCHKLHSPSEYDKASWDEWMEKMKKKAHLSDEQYNLLRRYFDALRSGEK